MTCPIACLLHPQVARRTLHSPGTFSAQCRKLLLGPIFLFPPLAHRYLNRTASELSAFLQPPCVLASAYVCFRSPPLFSEPGGGGGFIFFRLLLPLMGYFCHTNVSFSSSSRPNLLTLSPLSWARSLMVPAGDFFSQSVLKTPAISTPHLLLFTSAGVCFLFVVLCFSLTLDSFSKFVAFAPFFSHPGE